MIQWQEINLPKQWLLEQESPPAKPVFDELNLTHIQQYLDGIVKISFHDNQPLRINEGRHSFMDLRVFQKEIKISMNFCKRFLKNMI